MAIQDASFNRYKAFVSLAYRLGMKQGKVPANPARLVDRRKEDNGRVRWLTADEETKLRAAITARYPAELPAFDLALHTGMRHSEQCGLTWDCVDLERKQVTILRSKHGGTCYIRLNTPAVNALPTLKERSGGIGQVMVLAKAGHGYAAGHALKTPREWFARARRLADLENFRWHDLRHTFCSRLVMAGVGLREVQELAGHKSIVTNCRYAHLSPAHQSTAVSKLEGWSKGSEGTGGPTDTTTDTKPLGRKSTRARKTVNVSN